jgi:[ribosomal protein S5]-alanine N-acetyltransferase
MSDIVSARLVLRPINAEEVSAVLNGQRRPDWAADFPAEGDQVIAGRQRRGYATEAVQAMVADIFQIDGVQTVTAHVDLDNLASIRVLEKSGMTLCTQNQEQATYHIRRSPQRR